MRLLVLTALLQLTIFSLSAQERHIKIKLQPTEEGDDVRSPLLSIPYMPPVKVWRGAGEQIDSVLWEARMQSSTYFAEKFKKKQIDSTAFALRMRQYSIDTTKIMCDDTPNALYVLVKRHDNLITVCLLKRYNPYVDKEIMLSYHADSLKKWTVNNHPANAIKKLTIKFPYCIGAKVIAAMWDIRLIPFKTAYSYRDEGLNNMPLCFSPGKVWAAKTSQASIYLYKEEYTQYPVDGCSIKVKEGGVFQKDKISNGFRYKNNYSISDTLIINSKRFKIDSIAKDYSYIYLCTLTEKKYDIQLAPRYIAQIVPFLTNSKKYLVLDFWGTWCGPCIKKLPELRQLYARVNNKVDFLSICVDSPSNINKAKDIFRDYNINWHQLFNDMADSTNITANLSISCFPTYMILDRLGKIIFSNCGTEGFNDLNKFASALMKQ